ncbi:hypothetical protein [Salegentibacter chungangensis]|uniref:YARHG domain-containing protein n=1 Tax=Salegentibacter chungangensis TaxID=1335724 RepID=A0ABW3NSF1_9FLAO
MKIQLLFFLILTSFKVASSTPQIPDKLIYQGSEYEWNGYSPAVDLFKEKKFKPPKEALETTANYGIFLYTYSIIDNCLYLTDVKILISVEKDGVPQLDEKSVFKLYFPDNDKVLMKNYSGLQVIGYGDQIKRKTKGRIFFYNKDYFVFDINEGILNKTLDLNFKKFQKLKREQFEKLKNSSDFNKIKNDNRQNLIYYNEFRDEKFSMEEYLEMYILDNLKHLR